MNDILSAGKHADSLRLRNATLVVQRPAGETDTLKLQLSEDYLMGLAWVNPITDEYKPVTREFTILESIPAGFSYGWSVAVYTDCENTIRWMRDNGLLAEDVTIQPHGSSPRYY